LLSITDPDDDEFTVTIKLQEAIRFTLLKKYPNGTYGLEVRPMILDERKTLYSLILKMTDKNACPKTSKHTIRIQVPVSQKIDFEEPLSP
jgi:hypothetical protein